MTITATRSFVLDREPRAYHCADCHRPFHEGDEITVEQHDDPTGRSFVHRHADCGQRNAPASDDIYRKVGP